MVVKTCTTCKHEDKQLYEPPCGKCNPLDGDSYWEPQERDEVL